MGKRSKAETIMENERELPDDYPLYNGYIYVIDGKVIRVKENVTVGVLKAKNKYKSVKNCNVAARDLWHLLPSR